MATSRICSIDDCGKTAHARGYCQSHYDRWKLYGAADAPLRKHPNGTTRAWLAQHAGFSGDQCLIWPFSRNANGYGQTMIGGVNELASRVMCVIAHGDPPSPAHEAAHSCGKGHEGCVHPGHLRWATPAENCADRVLHGTENRGRRNGMSKLTEADVREIRRLAPSMSQVALGRIFGVCGAHVCGIVNRKEWAWLD